MKHIEAKLGTVATTPDFFDVIGQVSWYEEEGAVPPAPEPAPEAPAAEEEPAPPPTEE